MGGFDKTRQHFSLPRTPDPNPYLTNLIELYNRDQMVSIAQFRALIDELLKERIPQEKIKRKQPTIKQNKKYWSMIFDSLKKKENRKNV